MNIASSIPPAGVRVFRAYATRGGLALTIEEAGLVAFGVGAIAVGALAEFVHQYNRSRAGGSETETETPDKNDPITTAGDYSGLARPVRGLVGPHLELGVGSILGSIPLAMHREAYHGARRAVNRINQARPRHNNPIPRVLRSPRRRLDDSAMLAERHRRLNIQQLERLRHRAQEVFADFQAAQNILGM